MRDSVLVLVCNDSYLPFAKKLFANALEAGRWPGDLLLITNDAAVQPFTVGSRRVQIKQVSTVEHFDVSWSLYNSVVWNKLNLFEPDMKQWEHIVYLDCDITVQGDITSLREVTAFSAVPYRAYRLNALFLNRDTDLFRDLAARYDLDVVPLNTGVMAFPSSIITPRMFTDMVALYTRYKHVMYSDDEVINLYFYKNWKKLNATYSFDWEHYRKHLLPSAAPRIIHYVHDKSWQRTDAGGYGPPTRWSDAFYEMLSRFYSIRYALKNNIRKPVNKRATKTKNTFNKLLAYALSTSGYVSRINRELAAYNNIHRFPPGHFYSPIPDLQEIEKRHCAQDDPCAGIDFDFQNQESTLDELLPFYADLPWDFQDDANNLPYRYKNALPGTNRCAAAFLCLMMRRHRPAKIIEIGSGFLSAVMLDTNDLFFRNRPIDFTFITGQRQAPLLPHWIAQSNACRCAVIAERVQAADAALFRRLGPGDMVCIDSSHVSKACSDCNHLLFTVLPLLDRGVLIYFHDVFYPFDYPKSWLTKERRFWNESYLLRAFLMHNDSYKILFFPSAARKHQGAYFKKHMPGLAPGQEHCGGIWIQKVRARPAEGDSRRP